MDFPTERRLGFTILLVTVVCDQATKQLTLSWLAANGGFIALTPFLNIVEVWNEGISFGMFGDAPPPPWVWALFATAVSIGLSVWLWRADDRWLAVGLGLIVGGAMGNIIDRIGPAGAVFDFIDFYVGPGRYQHWPAFNLADAAITFGVGMILIDALPIRRRRVR